MPHSPSATDLIRHLDQQRDEAFLAAEEFTIPLVDFRERFGPPSL